jgi:hypothetical protein
MLDSLLYGMLFYVIALIIALRVYSNYSPLPQRIFCVILLCWIGHYIGSYVYTLMPSDSLLTFFNAATPEYSEMGTGFVKNMAWYIRQYVTGDSFLATIYFFSAFSFLGSVLWYLLFLQLSQWLKISNQRYIFPALVIMCWPSFLFFTSGIGKDSLCYFLIPLIFLSWSQLFYQRKSRAIMLIVLFLGLLLLTMIRPYLLIILVITCGFSSLKSINRITLQRLLLILVFIPVIIYVTGWVLKTQGNIDHIGLYNIEVRSVKQQEYLNEGAVFPILSHNPMMQPLLLPYNFTMNLIMPLFFLARNMTGLLASVENLFLLYLLYQCFNKRKVLRTIKSQIYLVQLCYYFFIVGMSFMAIINTNLGLAMRQKSMYLPAFLVIAMLVWLYNKQTKLSPYPN